MDEGAGLVGVGVLQLLVLVDVGVCFLTHFLSLLHISPAAQHFPSQQTPLMSQGPLGSLQHLCVLALKQP